mgnify:CR=1 FL=1
MPKSRHELILAIARAKLAWADQEDLEAVYINHVAEYLDKFTDEDIHRWAKSFDIACQNTEDPS